MRSIRHLKLVITLLVFIAPIHVHAVVRLPAILSDHMMLQAAQTISIWGWADPSEKVSVRLGGATRIATAGADGRWRVSFSPLAAWTESDQAEVLFMQGTVFDADGGPVAGAKVEVWHANLLGNYSFFDSAQSHFNLRRTIIADDQGRYSFQTIMPKGYGCPPGGSTATLLEQLGRHGQRPAHIHFFVSAPGHRKLTTQINIDGDEYLWDDFAFASREGLVPPVTRVADPAAIAARGHDKPFALIDFDFRLHREVAEAPSAQVERLRAAA